MELKEARNLIHNYYMDNGNEKYKNELLLNIDNPLVLEVLVKQADNHTFRTLVDNLGLSENLVCTREQMERNIINNPDKYPLIQVQQALCDILFHNNKQNSILTITTIQERASQVPVYNNLYQNFDMLYTKVLEFLSLDPNTATPEQISVLLQEIAILNNELIEGNTSTYNVTSFLFNTAKEDFKCDLSTKMTHTSEKIFKGIEPETRIGPNGKPIKVYILRNQTENQRDLHILARTQNKEPYMTEEDAMVKHISYVSQYHRASYSVFSETINNGFAGMHRITFGYSNVGTQILSCTTMDGQTNQWEIMDGKVTIRPQFQTIENFMANTGRYNEIVFDNPENIVPTMIISTTDMELSDDVIAVAEAMDIPIVIIDKEAYPNHTIDVTPYTEKDWYTYETFIPNELEPITSELVG